MPSQSLRTLVCPSSGQSSHPPLNHTKFLASATSCGNEEASAITGDCKVCCPRLFATAAVTSSTVTPRTPPPSSCKTNLKATSLHQDEKWKDITILRQTNLGIMEKHNKWLKIWSYSYILYQILSGLLLTARASVVALGYTDKVSSSQWSTVTLYWGLPTFWLCRG